MIASPSFPENRFDAREDVKATFSDGVLEVSVPTPVRPEAKMRKVEIQESPKAAKSAA
jgi:HSP20 family molecular chaperone IbpA